MDKEVELEQLLCWKCGKPVEVTKGSKEKILCLSCYMEMHPELFE